MKEIFTNILKAFQHVKVILLIDVSCVLTPSRCVCGSENAVWIAEQD